MIFTITFIVITMNKKYKFIPPLKDCRSRKEAIDEDVSDTSSLSCESLLFPPQHYTQSSVSNNSNDFITSLFKSCQSMDEEEDDITSNASSLSCESLLFPGLSFSLSEDQSFSSSRNSNTFIISPYVL